MLTDDWMTSADVAALLGVTISTLSRWRRDRYGPRYVIRPKRKYLYRRADVEAWIVQTDIA